MLLRLYGNKQFYKKPKNEITIARSIRIRESMWNKLDEFKKDINTSPKFLKTFSYVQSNAGEYIIKTQPVVAIFYNHQESHIYLFLNKCNLFYIGKQQIFCLLFCKSDISYRKNQTYSKFYVLRHF